MMKRMKANDGYALGFVMIVLVVLCTIAIGVSAISLNNLKNQQRSIDRMIAKYEAQGLVEQVVAQIEACEDDTALNTLLTNIHTAMDGKVEIQQFDGENLTFIAKQTTTQITVKLTAVQNTETTKNEETGEETTETISGYKVTYISYSTEVTS